MLEMKLAAPREQPFNPTRIEIGSQSHACEPPRVSSTENLPQLDVEFDPGKFGLKTEQTFAESELRFDFVEFDLEAYELSLFCGKRIHWFSFPGTG